MDLEVQLQKAFQDNITLPMKLYTGYLIPDANLHMYTMPGGRILSEDMAGNITKQINYEIAIRTQNYDSAQETLYNIGQFLDDLGMDSISSADNSYLFNSVQVTGQPFPQQMDEEGYALFILDFQIEIQTQIERK